MDSDALYSAVISISLGYCLSTLRFPRDSNSSNGEGGQNQHGGLALPRVWLQSTGALALCGVAASVVAVSMSSPPRGLRVIVLLCVSAVVLALAVALFPAVRPRARQGRWVSTRPRRTLWMTGGAGLLAMAVAVGWTIAPSGELPSALATYPSLPFYVYGTCVHDKCGLNRRVRPSSDASTRGRRLADGERVIVRCQRYGGLVRAKGGRRSRLWNLLGDNTWVSDLFITTSKRGAESRGVPRCPPGLVR
jgi:hypothetical protein